MFGPLATVIVQHMDIGKTIRCYTIEPLRDPVPAPREYSVRVPDRVPSYGRGELELDPVSGRAVLPGDSTLEYVLAPAVLRRISG
jgi:hypothetical protein